MFGAETKASNNDGDAVADQPTVLDELHLLVIECFIERNLGSLVEPMIRYDVSGGEFFKIDWAPNGSGPQIYVNPYWYDLVGHYLNFEDDRDYDHIEAALNHIIIKHNDFLHTVFGLYDEEQWASATENFVSRQIIHGEDGSSGPPDEGPNIPPPVKPFEDMMEEEVTEYLRNRTITNLEKFEVGDFIKIFGLPSGHHDQLSSILSTLKVRLNDGTTATFMQDIEEVSPGRVNYQFLATFLDIDVVATPSLGKEVLEKLIQIGVLVGTESGLTRYIGWDHWIPYYSDSDLSSSDQEEDEPREHLALKLDKVEISSYSDSDLSLLDREEDDESRENSSSKGKAVVEISPSESLEQIRTRLEMKVLNLPEETLIPLRLSLKQLQILKENQDILLEAFERGSLEKIQSAIVRKNETPDEIAKRKGWDLAELLEGNKKIELRADTQLRKGTELFLKNLIARSNTNRAKKKRTNFNADQKIKEKIKIIKSFLKSNETSELKRDIADAANVEINKIAHIKLMDLRRLKFHIEDVKAAIKAAGKKISEPMKMSIIERFKSTSIVPKKILFLSKKKKSTKKKKKRENRGQTRIRLEAAMGPIRERVSEALEVNTRLLKDLMYNALKQVESQLEDIKADFASFKGKLDDNIRMSMINKASLTFGYARNAKKLGKKVESRKQINEGRLNAAVAMSSTLCETLGLNVGSLNEYGKFYLKRIEKFAKDDISKSPDFIAADQNEKMRRVGMFLDMYNSSDYRKISLITPAERTEMRIQLKKENKDEDGEGFLVVSHFSKEWIEIINKSTKECQHKHELHKPPFFLNLPNGQRTQLQEFNSKVILRDTTTMFDVLGNSLNSHRNTKNTQTLRSNIHGALELKGLKPLPGSTSSQASSNSSNHPPHHDSRGRGLADWFGLFINSFELEKNIRRFQASESQNVRVDFNENMIDVVNTGGMHLVIWRVGVNNRRKHGVTFGEGLRHSWVHRMNENDNKFSTWDEWKKKVCSVFGDENVEEK